MTNKVALIKLRNLLKTSLTVLENILFIAFIGLVWFWFDSVGARDTAISKGKDLTDRTNLQFLDESVACTHIRLARNSKGHVQILRIYDFDVSASGGDRMHCQLTLLGRDLHAWYIPPYLQALH